MGDLLSMAHATAIAFALALRNLTDNAQWARAFERDFRSACPDLEPPDRALLDYVEKLTMAPASVSLGHVT